MVGYFIFAVWISIIHSLNSEYVLSSSFLRNLESLRLSTSPNSQLLFPEGNVRFILLFVEKFGLGNRLRTIADWYVISLLTNRKLIVSWKPSSECNITFADMFESVPSSLYLFEHPLLGMDSDGSASLQKSLIEQGISYHFFREANLPWTSDLGFLVKKDIFLDPNIQVIVTNYDGLLTLQDVPCHFYQDKRHYLLSNLRPRTEFTDAIQQILTTHFSDVLPIGVHIRINDPMYDWAVVPPLAGADKAKEFDESAKLEDFISLMQQINQYFQFDFPVLSSLSSQKSLVKFFIASNSPQIKEIVSNLFPDQAVFLSFPSMSRNTVDGMKQAFLEWLLLSEMSLVVNTYGSSFAMEATQRTNIPLVGVYEGYYIYQTSESLPFCGNLQFAKVFSTRTSKTRFTEGTIDNREVSAIYCEKMCVDLYRMSYIDSSSSFLVL